MGTISEWVGAITGADPWRVGHGSTEGGQVDRSRLSLGDWHDSFMITLGARRRASRFAAITTTAHPRPDMSADLSRRSISVDSRAEI
jgi:hypothetical protein